MPDTPNLSLPLLASAQAQKHVTVNEALSRLDALTHITITSRSQTSPPLSPEEGERHIVPAAATGAWSGQANNIAIFLNGGWVFAAPGYGWRAEILDENQSAAYDGLAWRPGALAVTQTGAATSARILIYDHQITGGPTSDIAAAIPDRSIVLGVTARVTTAITGAASWRLGVPSSDNRYGAGIGAALHSEAHGITSQPLGYYGDTALRLTADSGVFTGGEIRVAVHLLALTPPAIL